MVANTLIVLHFSVYRIFANGKMPHCRQTRKCGSQKSFGQLVTVELFGRATGLLTVEMIIMFSWSVGSKHCVYTHC